MKFTWLRRDDQTLCLEGFPIQIKKLPVTECQRFAVVVEGKTIVQRESLDEAYWSAEQRAKDLAAFMDGPESPPKCKTPETEV